MDGYGKVRAEGERRADKRDVRAEQGEQLVGEWMLEKVSSGCSSPLLGHGDSHDHFPVSTVYVSAGRVTTAPLSLRASL